VTTVYDFAGTGADGKQVPLHDYEGKVLLIVNVASKCGLTPQYEGLESLYRDDKDRGLEVLGFPCNQFKEQEPGSNEEIQDFCTSTYDVTFPVFAKIEVNGPLIGRDGEVIKRYEPPVPPADIKADLENYL
jgi:glutathione peroxidase